VETNVNIIGRGLDDALAAANASALLSPVSVSFGAVPAISGQTQTAPVTITNGGPVRATWALSRRSDALGHCSVSHVAETCRSLRVHRRR
jgi:hypothetical protein